MHEIFHSYVFSGVVLSYANFIYDVDEIRFIMDWEINKRAITNTLVDG